MDDFPADEAELAALMNVRSRRGRFDVAEEYFYRKNAASFTYSNFHVSRRGRHHWDVIAPVVPGRDEARRAAISEIDLGFEYAEHERAFVIRGDPTAFERLYHLERRLNLEISSLLDRGSAADLRLAAALREVMEESAKGW